MKQNFQKWEHKCLRKHNYCFIKTNCCMEKRTSYIFNRTNGGLWCIQSSSSNENFKNFHFCFSDNMEPISQYCSTTAELCFPLCLCPQVQPGARLYEQSYESMKEKWLELSYIGLSLSQLLSEAVALCQLASNPKQLVIYTI